VKRLLAVAAAVLALAAVPAAWGQLPTTPADLPGFRVPNAPGSIRVPSPLSRPPARPEVRSYAQLVTLWKQAGAAYGVPWQVLGAINKIESGYGENMGPSSAGALGWMQFIPSTWMRWGMDADGDRIANPWDPEDAVFAAARYLAAAGAQEDIERAIFAYNHAQWYVDDVLELAGALGDEPFTPGPVPFVSPGADLQARVEAAQRRMKRLSEALDLALGGIEGREWVRLRLERRLGDPKLSDAEFAELDTRLQRLDTAEESSWQRINVLQARLAKAVETLTRLKEERANAMLLGGSGEFVFPATSGSVAGGQQSVDGWVFPVGGGPTNVSTAHTHHDYPAADIAAPTGSPVYALHDAVVTDLYPTDSGRCGIGLTLRTTTGEEFVYCHLSLLDPHLTPGTPVSAGDPVGSVGSTGNSTGPHLHLGYTPSTHYPQAEPWFQAFAGIAFEWQDAPTPERSKPVRASALERRASVNGPVFRVIRAPRVIRFTTASSG
jgi:murein DD-endopeptidase MepM/ murein hydrolase activator NlpD